MRALYLEIENFSVNDLVHVTGDGAHHLNVTRVRMNDHLLILNGKGQRIYADVVSISKNDVELKIKEIESVTKAHHLSLAIACPKKDAFEDIIKMAVELGCHEIYPLSSEYSQYDFEKSDRLHRIVESALIQSNNAFYPHICEQRPLTSFLNENSKPLAFFNSVTSEEKVISDLFTQDELIILIGPEGGFSPAEIEAVRASKSSYEIHLPTPILRAPTATATAFGYLLARINK